MDGGICGPKLDVYSIGGIFFNMLSGHRPPETKFSKDMSPNELDDYLRQRITDLQCKELVPFLGQMFRHNPDERIELDGCAILLQIFFNELQNNFQKSICIKHLKKILLQRPVDGSAWWWPEWIGRVWARPNLWPYSRPQPALLTSAAAISNRWTVHPFLISNNSSIKM